MFDFKKKTKKMKNILYIKNYFLMIKFDRKHARNNNNNNNNKNIKRFFLIRLQ